MAFFFFFFLNVIIVLYCLSFRCIANAKQSCSTWVATYCGLCTWSWVAARASVVVSLSVKFLESEAVEYLFYGFFKTDSLTFQSKHRDLLFLYTRNFRSQGSCIALARHVIICCAGAAIDPFIRKLVISKLSACGKVGFTYDNCCCRIITCLSQLVRASFRIVASSVVGPVGWRVVSTFCQYSSMMFSPKPVDRYARELLLLRTYLLR